MLSHAPTIGCDAGWSMGPGHPAIAGHFEHSSRDCSPPTLGLPTRNAFQYRRLHPLQKTDQFGEFVRAQRLSEDVVQHGHGMRDVGIDLMRAAIGEDDPVGSSITRIDMPRDKASILGSIDESRYVTGAFEHLHADVLRSEGTPRGQPQAQKDAERGLVVLTVLPRIQVERATDASMHRLQSQRHHEEFQEVGVRGGHLGSTISFMRSHGTTLVPLTIVVYGIIIVPYGTFPAGTMRGARLQ